MSQYCNRFDQNIAKQRLNKHFPTCNNIWETVFYVVCAKQQKNMVMQSVSRQRLGKHISADHTVLCNAVTSSTIHTVFSVGSVQSAYKRSEFRNKLVQGSCESVAGRAQPEEVRCEEELEVTQTRDICSVLRIGLEYSHRSPESRRGRRKGNPVTVGITGPLCH
jgi:hypothetical protein